MCGIAGSITTTPIADERIRAALHSMARRGPDGAGSYTGKTPEGRAVTLLHRRLAILDLDARANQPFTVGDETLIFNGECYNYGEIKSTLPVVTWRTSSDTEVVFWLLHHEGIAGLDRIEGMFALAFFHHGTGALLLARDRFGEKPLSYYQDSTGLYFGSEPKAIVALRGERFRPNFCQTRRYLVNGYRSLYKEKETWWEELKEVEPGTAIEIGTRAMTTTRYGRLLLKQDEAMTRGEAIAGIREHLTRSVQLRIHADVPVAFCLSGGIDSVSLLSLARRQGYDCHAFHILSTDPRYEETQAVEQVVRQCAVRYTPIAVATENFLENLRVIVRYHEAPVATMTFYTHWLLMRAIHEAGYKVAISGTAADELLAGYYDHHLWYLAQTQDQGEWATEVLTWELYIARHIRNPFLRDPRQFIRHPKERAYLYPGADRWARIARRADPFMESWYSADMLRNRMLNEIFHETTPVILHEEDRNAMQWGVENRSPFLDHALFAFAQRIPTRYLMEGAWNKSVLRKAMRGIIPEFIQMQRRKVGWNASLSDLFPTMRMQTWLREPSPLDAIVAPSVLRPFLAKPSYTAEEEQFLWRVINARIFLEECP